MNLRKSIAAVALLASTSAFAGFHGFSDPAPTNKFSGLLDRNYNQQFGHSDWFNRIQFSGLLGGYAMISNRNPSLGRFNDNRTSSDITLNRVNLYMHADVNDWVHADVSLAFAQDLRSALGFAQSLGVYAINDEANYRNFGIVDEAIVTMGNLERYPTYLRAGIGYAPYGHYLRNRTPATLVQMLTQTQVALIQLGFVDTSGWNGAIYTFRGLSKRPTSNPTINNFGVQLGYCWQDQEWGVDATVDYMFNIASAVNAVRPAPAAVAAAVPPANVNYSRVVGGIHVGVTGYYQQFDGTVQFTTALRSFGTGIVNDPGAGRRPAALLLGAGYSFPLMDMHSRLGISYQQSFQARLLGARASAPTNPAAAAPAAPFAGFVMPQHRVQGDFTMDVWKNTQVGMHVVWDNPYRTGGVRPSSSTTGFLSLQVKVC